MFEIQLELETCLKQEKSDYYRNSRAHILKTELEDSSRFYQRKLNCKLKNQLETMERQKKENYRKNYKVAQKELYNLKRKTSDKKSKDKELYENIVEKLKLRFDQKASSCRKKTFNKGISALEDEIDRELRDFHNKSALKSHYLPNKEYVPRNQRYNTLLNSAYEDIKNSKLFNNTKASASIGSFNF